MKASFSEPSSRLGSGGLAGSVEGTDVREGLRRLVRIWVCAHIELADSRLAGTATPFNQGAPVEREVFPRTVRLMTDCG